MKTVITKKEWAALGGLQNPRLFRMHNGKRWIHYEIK